MYTLYKDGKEISADRDQLDALKEDGWATVKPEVEVAVQEASEESGDPDSDEEGSGNKLESADEDADNRRLNLE